MNGLKFGWIALVASIQLYGANTFSANQENPMSKSTQPWAHFKKPDKKVLKEKLTPIQFDVTQEEGTERPFKNEYWDNHQAGLYVDVVSGEPLFSSADKFESGTGWPSFTQPLSPDAVVTKVDRRLFSTRTEVRSKRGDSHLGHVFEDGPPPTGKRYCMNSAAMRFIPADQLKKEGYEEYLKLFAPPNPKTSAGDSSATTSGQFETATLAGGCFWGVEELIRQLPGVVETNVGYSGGSVDSPNYEIVKTGTSGHAEAIEVKFDPKKLTYEALLRYFFRLHDPTTKNQQGNDVGTQYRSAIFYHSASQRDVAERVKLDVEKSGKWKKPLVTEIVAFKKFYAAEDDHQDYLKKNPGGYTCHYLRD